MLEAHWAFGGGVNASADIWERAVPLDTPGVLGLGAEDRLLYLCLHISRHQMMVSAYHYCDLAYLLSKTGPEIDYELLERLAPGWGQISGTRLVLAVLAELFPDLDTLRLRTALGEEPIDEGLVRAALRCVLAPPHQVRRAHRISQRATTPSLLLPDDLMRTIHDLPHEAPVPWRLHAQTLGKRALGWFADRQKLTGNPQLSRRVQEQERLQSWLSGSR